VRNQNETAFMLVDSAHAFAEMSAALETAPWVSIDLEHHSMHSFHGFVCLMQLSTETHDFIIDPLCPEVRTALLDLQQSAILRRLLMSPSCLTILHGCDNDMAWLATNFNMYLIGVLDTAQLAKAVGASSRSLAVLLKRHFNVKVDKQHQLADWRQRPLPAKLLTYARGDTRHLAQLAHVLGSKLLVSEDRAAAVAAVVEKCHQLTLSAHARHLGTSFSPSRWLRTWSRWLARTAADAALREETSPLAGSGLGGDAVPHEDSHEHLSLMALKGAFPVPSDALQALAQLPRLAFTCFVACELRHAVAVAWDEGGDAVQSQSDTLMAGLVTHACTSPHQSTGYSSSVSAALHACLPSGTFCPRGSFSARTPLRDPPLSSSGMWSPHDITLACDMDGLQKLFLGVLVRAASASTDVVTAALDRFAVLWWQEQSEQTREAAAAAGDATPPPSSLHDVLRRRHAVGPVPAANTPAAREAAKAERWAQISHNYSRKHLYDSCELLNVDGSTLAFIERRRADWYIRKELATLVDDGMGDSPATPKEGGGGGATSIPTRVDDEQAKSQKRRIVLQLVRPARGGGATQYNNMPKSNLCVRCGDTELLSKFYIVPRAFRQRFPEDAKSHSCHDVVLLCATCRRIVEPMYARLLKAQAREWGLTSGMYSVHGPSGLLMSDLGIQVPTKPKKRKGGDPREADTPPAAADGAEEGARSDTGTSLNEAEHFERLAITLCSTQQSCEAAMAIMGQRGSTSDFSVCCSAVVWGRLPAGLRALLRAMATLQVPLPSQPREEWCDIASACGFEDPRFLMAAQGSSSFGRVQTSLRQVLGQTRTPATASQVVRSALTLVVYLATVALHLPVLVDGSIPGLLPSLEALFKLATAGAYDLLAMPDASRKATACSEMSSAWIALLQEVQGSDMCHSLRSTLGASKAEEKFTATMMTRWRDAVGNFVSSFTTDASPQAWLPTQQSTDGGWVFERGVGRAAVTQHVPAEPTHHGTPIVSSQTVAAIMHGVSLEALCGLHRQADACSAVEALVHTQQRVLPEQLQSHLQSQGGGSSTAAGGAAGAGVGPTALEELESYLAKHTLHVPQAALAVHYTLYPREHQLQQLQANLEDMPGAADDSVLDGLDECDALRSGQNARFVARQLAAAPALHAGVVYVPANANRPFVPPHLPQEDVQERLHSLVHRFRDFFLQSVQPQHMPEGWHSGLEVFLPGSHKHHRMPPRASGDCDLPTAAQAWQDASAVPAQ